MKTNICLVFNIFLYFATIFLAVNGQHCPPLPGLGVKNGSYKVIDRHNVRVLCNAGYYPVGREYLQCRKGKWNQPFPTKCFPLDNRCPDPPKIENGEVWGDDRNVGSLIQYSCHDGFFMSGQDNRQCLDSFHWDGTTPLCIARKNSPVDVVNILNKQLLHGKGFTPITERALGEEVFQYGLDLIFLLDSSSSIDPFYFKKGIEFANSILDVFGVSNGKENGTRVAVVTFDEVPKIIFNLDDSKINLQEAKEKLRKLKSEGGGTALDGALTTVIADIAAQGLLRKKAKRAIFIITDASPTVSSGSVSSADMAKHLKKHEKFEIFAVGVGKDVDKVLLSEIASNPVTNHVFFLDKYTDFDKICFLIQNEPATTTSAPPTPVQCGNPQKINSNFSSPWLAAIYIKHEENVEFCAGVLVCSQWVLTSAKCVRSKSKNFQIVNASQILVTVGDYNLFEDEGTEMNMFVTDIKLSPQLNGSKNAVTRLALLRLHQAVPEIFTYQTVCVPRKSVGQIPLSMNLNTNTSLEGWGTPPTNFKSKLLSAAYVLPTSKRIVLDIVESEKCKKIINKHHKNENAIVKEKLMCAGTEDGFTSCSGNLGSPLIAIDHNGFYNAIGILTAHHGCSNKYNIFLRLLNYRNWISRATEDCLSNHTEVKIKSKVS